MTRGTKLWIGLVATAAALVTVWHLPPDSRTPLERSLEPAASLRYAELFRQTRATVARIRWAEWSESVSRSTVERGPDEPVVVAPGDMAERLDLHGRISAAIDGLPARAPEMAFGYFVDEPSTVTHGEHYFGDVLRRGTFVGERDGSSYCVQLDHVPGPMGDRYRAVTVEWILGPCRFYLAYGRAGPGIESWLRGGGAGFAGRSGIRPDVPPEAVRSVLVTRVFGFNSISGRHDPIEIDRCRVGLAEACAVRFRNPTGGSDFDPMMMPEAPLLWDGRRVEVGSLGGDEAFLLADLEAEFGPDAFRRFWTSARDVEAAFEDGFGTTSGEWTAAWVVRNNATPLTHSPRLSRADSSGTMLAVMLFLGLAFLQHRRRRLA